jgi:hypothetical protein
MKSDGAFPFAVPALKQQETRPEEGEIHQRVIL